MSQMRSPVGLLDVDPYSSKEPMPETALAPDVERPAAKTTPRLGSAVVVLDGDCVLLGIRGKEPNKGKWVLPGGKIKPFESIEHAAIREIREETGLAVEVHGQLGVWEIIDPPEEHRVIVYSLARPIGGTLKAASDLDEVRFCHRDELDGLDISDLVCRVLDRVTWAD
jgi:8-oxo-dGTP diphosphatase